MAINRAGKHAVVLSSVPLQLMFYLTAVYFLLYFLCTLCIAIYKSRVLSYPDDLLSQDVGLLFSMAALELLRLYFGVKGNLLEKEGYLWANLAMTVGTAMLSIYFLVWQTYVMRADIILNCVLLCVYVLGGVLALVTLARFTRSAWRTLFNKKNSYEQQLSVATFFGRLLLRAFWCLVAVKIGCTTVTIKAQET